MVKELISYLIYISLKCAPITSWSCCLLLALIRLYTRLALICFQEVQFLGSVVGYTNFLSQMDRGIKITLSGLSDIKVINRQITQLMKSMFSCVILLLNFVSKYIMLPHRCYVNVRCYVKY